MSAQGSLFSPGCKTVDPGRQDAPAPRQSRHIYAITRKPEVPCEGSRDKSCKYWYQRMHDEIAKLPEKERNAAFEIILDWPYDRIDALRKIINRYCSANQLEQDNFHEAMGR